MRTIAIILCDNDFGNTFKPLLNTLYHVIRYRGEYTPSFIEKCIREGIRFHYLGFQHRDTENTNNELEIIHTLKYLLKGVRILFDDEAEKFIENNDHDGGSWYLEIQTGQTYSF